MKIRTSVGVAALAVAVLTGCETPKGNLTGQSGKVDTSASTQPATDSSTPATDSSPTPEASSAPPAPERGKTGQAINISSDEGLKAAVKVVTVRRTKRPASEFAGAAKNGTYVVVKVLITVAAGDYDFNPFYFHYQSADGTTYDASSGAFAGFEPALSSGRLHTGQRTGGLVVFDAPVGKGVLQLTDTAGGVVGEWDV